MANNYTFLDGAGSVQTAQASVVSGTVLRPQVDIGSILGGSVPVVFASSPSSIITTFSQSPSIVGTFAEDAAHASGDKGVLSLNVRNDTLSSVTSADGDYGAIALGPAGEVVTANSPITKWISGTASMIGGTPVNGGSVMVIAAQGASVFTYITGIQIANPSANNVWLKFSGATDSVLGYTMAPANGGSNIVLPNAWKTNANGAFTASISAVGSVYLTVEGFISKT